MATIIKTHLPPQASGSALRGVAYDLQDMDAQADIYLQSVRKEATKIVEEARREAANIRRDAEAAGRAAAEQAIERILDEKVAKQMTTLKPAMESAVKHLVDAKQDWLRHWETSAIELAAAIAGRLVRGELARRPEISLVWLREALELAAGAGELAIHLHPSDYQIMERQVEQVARLFAPAARLQVVPDETVTLGGCKVVTEFGVVDAQLETQLNRVTQELTS